MEKITLQVEGMSCGHCVKSVEKAVSGIAGVDSVQVDLGEKKVHVTYNSEKATVGQIKEAIEESGYDIVE